jgi:hypothetical protein
MPIDDRTNWQLKFAIRLHQLQPGIAGHVTAQIAADTYPDARDLAPEEAAEIYALEQPPGDVGAPGN